MLIEQLHLSVGRAREWICGVKEGSDLHHVKTELCWTPGSPVRNFYVQAGIAPAERFPLELNAWNGPSA